MAVWREWETVGIFCGNNHSIAMRLCIICLFTFMSKLDNFGRLRSSIKRVEAVRTVGRVAGVEIDAVV